MKDPATVSDWLPVIQTAVGAVVALSGVTLTLIVTGRRSRRESLTKREDEIRAKGREAVALVLAAGSSYERHALELSDPTAWAPRGYELASALSDQTDAAMALMNERLLSARLMLADEPISAELKLVEDSFHETAGMVHGVVDAFWGGRDPRNLLYERTERWERWDAAMELLTRKALSDLPPTLREEERDRRPPRRAELPE